MNWIVAGLIAGVGAFFADWFMWSKVFMKGMDAYSTPVPPEQMQRLMAANMPKSAVLALVFGVVLSILRVVWILALLGFLVLVTVLVLLLTLLIVGHFLKLLHRVDTIQEGVLHILKPALSPRCGLR